MKFVFGIWFEEYVMSIEEDGLTKSDLEYGDEIEVMEDWIAMEFMKMKERMNEDMKKSTKKQKNYSNSFSTFLKG